MHISTQDFTVALLSLYIFGGNYVYFLGIGNSDHSGTLEMPVKFLPATDALLTVEVVLSKVKALCTRAQCTF